MFFHFLIAVVLKFAFISGCVNTKIPAFIQQQEGYISGSDNVRLYYRIFGSGSDTIVMLHGGPGLDMGYLSPDLEPLADSFVLIFYDQRGSGKSTLIADSLSVSLDKHVEDLESVRQFFKLNQLMLLGHSWGSLLAAGYALQHPEHVKKIVFSSPAPLRHSYIQHLIPNITRWMDSTARAQLDVLRKTRQDINIDARTSCDSFWKLFKYGYFADPFDTVTINRMKGNFCSGSSASIRNGMKINPYVWASISDWDWRQHFTNFRKPVLIITGKMDIFPEEAMLEWDAAFPHSKLVLIDGAGHYPQVEKPLIYFNNVRAFLY